MTSRPSPLADLSRIATFAALIAVLGLPGAIPAFGGAVPITLQTLGVMLAGAVLGWWRGALSVIVFLVLVAIGLPLLSGGRGGLGVFVGPSAGYLIGFVAGAAVTGWIIGIRRSAKPGWARVLTGTVVGGMLVVYLFGIPLQALITGVPLGQTAFLSLVFLPGDLVKSVITTVVVVALWKAYPRAFASDRIGLRHPVAERAEAS